MSQNISLNVSFKIDGIQFPESIIATLQDNVRKAIERWQGEGQLTNHDSHSAELISVSHLSPVINVMLDGGLVADVTSNTPGIIVNIFDEDDGADEENVFEHKGGDRVYLYSEHAFSIPEQTSSCEGMLMHNIWTKEAKAFRIIQNETATQETVLLSYPHKLCLRPVYHSDETEWTLTRPHTGFFELGYEIFYSTAKNGDVVIYRFKEEQSAECAITVWTEYRNRMFSL